MKKIVLSLVFVGLLYQSQAQVYLGGKAGISFLSMTRGGLWERDYDDLGNLGFNFGASFEYVVSDYFTLYPKLMFARKGTEWYKKTGSTRSDIYNLNYLEIPLTVKINYPLDLFTRTLDIYAQIGPQVSFLIGGKASEQGTSIIGLRVLKVEEFFNERNQEYKKFDAGLILGFGTALHIGPGKLLLEADYDLSFINLAEDQPILFYYKALGAHRVWSIDVGYLYEF